MSFELLVARLGLAEVARRAGVSQATVKRWLREGPSQKGAKALAGILRRHSASTKAAEGRRRRMQERVGAQVPPATELTPEQVLPPRAASESREVKRIKQREKTEGGVVPIDSEVNIGEETWVTIGRDINDLDNSEVVDSVVSIWQDSGRDYVSVRFFFLRFIPFNPLYKGELAKKAGKWVDFWWRTQAASAKDTITRYVEGYLDLARKKGESRVIFLEMIGVSTLNRRRELDLTMPLRR